MPRPGGILFLEFVSSVVLAKDVMDNLLTGMAVSWVTQSIAKTFKFGLQIRKLSFSKDEEVGE